MMGRLHQKDLSGPCGVYCIVNPRTRNPFYVGISKYPWSRFDQHRVDVTSAAWEEMNLWLRHYPPTHVFKIYKWCPDRQAALDLEYRLIHSVPGLLNRDGRRFRVFERAA
jgi:predicted GIY-YIG superfamily endonuclease